MKAATTAAVLASLLALLFLAGCSKSQAPVDDEPPGPSGGERLQLEAPVGRLGDAVVPIHYRLELRIDPTEESFSGKVSIDVEVRESLESLWLHGEGFDIDEIFLIDPAGDRIAASYEQKHDSGVSLVSLGRTVDAGMVTLDIRFRRPFETGHPI